MLAEKTSRPQGVGRVKIRADEIWDLSCSPGPLSHLSEAGHASPCYSFIYASIIAAIWNRTFVASIALSRSSARFLALLANGRCFWWCWLSCHLPCCPCCCCWWWWLSGTGGEPARLPAGWHSKGAGMTLAGPEKDIFQSGSFLGTDFKNLKKTNLTSEIVLVIHL